MCDISGRNINFIVNAIQPEKIKAASIIVLVAGMHDVFSTPWKNIEVSLRKLREKCKDKKIVIALVPPRYDRNNSNFKVLNFNANLKQHIIKNMQNTTYLDTHRFLQRRHMTRNMMYLNKTGKFVLTIKITQHIQNIVSGKKQVTFKRNDLKSFSTVKSSYERPLSSFMPRNYALSSGNHTIRKPNSEPFTMKQRLQRAQSSPPTYSKSVTMQQPSPPTYSKSVTMQQRVQPSPPKHVTPLRSGSFADVCKCSCNSTAGRISLVTGQTNGVPGRSNGRVNMINNEPVCYVTYTRKFFDNEKRNFRLTMTTLV